MRMPAAAMVTADRISFTIRAPRADYDAWQALYYATVNQHRSSFNGWILELIRSAVRDAWYAADCPPVK